MFCSNTKKRDELAINLEYAVQPSPDGLAQAFLIGEKFIDNQSCALILGDNLFFGHDLQKKLIKVTRKILGSTIFAYPVSEPERYGIVELDNNEKILSIEEKPKNPKSSYAITGLYFYDNNVVDIAKEITPSKRGELEITSINEVYFEQKQLKVEIMGRGMTWLDTGTHESLLEASQFVYIMEKRQGLNIACLEEISWRNNWITTEDLEKIIKKYKNSYYKEYLKRLVKRKVL